MGSGDEKALRQRFGESLAGWGDGESLEGCGGSPRMATALRGIRLRVPVAVRPCGRPIRSKSSIRRNCRVGTVNHREVRLSRGG